MHLPTLSRPLGCAAAVVIGLALADGAKAQPSAPAAPDAPDAVIVVHPTQWRWAGGSYDDLDALAALMLPRTPRSVGLYACGDDAARLQKAAAHRFRYLRLDLRVLDAQAPLCEGQADLRVAALAPAAGIPVPVVDDAAVDAWWSLLMP